MSDGQRMSDEDRAYCLRRLDKGAYYYSLHATGCSAVDLILGAVNAAGKSYHHTEGWTDGSSGPSAEDLIQMAADEAAGVFRNLEARLRVADSLESGDTAAQLGTECALREAKLRVRCWKRLEDTVREVLGSDSPDQWERLELALTACDEVAEQV